MKIICVGLNYQSHNKEMNRALSSKDDDPVLFMKPDTALLNADKHEFYIPDFSSDIHYETELVVRIDKMGKNIAERFAHRYYKEITLGIDFTARDIQAGLKAKSLPWEISKAFDNSAAIGTFVDKDKFGKGINDLNFQLKIDNNIVQSGNTSEMIHPVDKIIAYASRFFTLKTGDLIFTGTPAGVGKVAIGNQLSGTLEDEELLSLNIC
ncbi:2-keto-4-pentenoate hydratase/2-oxohepta-3-ene-1,7-dioic acid hydratase in catechol pathway [Dysgonomonas sp. PFB1-18]|uniref:fumarylacetoacetate hydrolase family protein n=1 Tax=unclassified Dysgonomonas TaxID=2630389 RepID=UPI002473B2C6|nr:MULTISPECIES: fumarylacetoacetate hydrolase family protein [unclassified Dysgonomonas]MDH6309127.1 2-keto-4-pentenoate hydratase/2-oxohepta-3-ene-1,7-dioic acid hydratase in catechol pathway [Dysgonomonas sp. PF1-14]MDH6338993.1 2-keto-4-pentenoate hydratase/2-oxohepta-3-ene-1,7-dioic acid hydratase in catechol pathway [Dysgonomonas sp. PF1-16]MDH6380376.1 2-keto-4-pentenoate hydratase/2-oxohepta-3-ene-1,7-dioic acid hydratase in catechol pathway [Dysgonomonas sp. PFB1-18]MDH6397821.1 2-keto